MNRDQTPEIPPMVPIKARRLLVGLVTFQIGVGVAAWSTGTGRPLLGAWLAAVLGFGLAAASGVFRFAPTSPRQLSLTATAARWPPAVVVPVGLLAIAVNIAGVGYGFYAAFLTG